MANLDRLMAEAEFADLQSVTVRMPASWVVDFEELADCIGITRSEVMREAMLSGLRELQSQWATGVQKKNKPRGE